MGNIDVKQLSEDPSQNVASVRNTKPARGGKDYSSELRDEYFPHVQLMQINGNFFIRKFMRPFSFTYGWLKDLLLETSKVYSGFLNDIVLLLNVSSHNFR